MFNRPLADLLRPASLDEVMGQTHLVGKNGSLRLSLESGIAHSMILWGPPGVGKTTLARILANGFEAELVMISAVLSGVKEIRDVIENAKTALATASRRTILFVDEVHRFNKSQQDAFLPHVENGLLTLIGATTENPSFEVNSALLSRVQVYKLERLAPETLRELFKKIQKKALFNQVTFDKNVIMTLANHADGDARRFLNVIEQLLSIAKANHLTHIDELLFKEVIGTHIHLFDKKGDHFHDQISAMHKSMRGSNPNAALYWFCRMLVSGADPRYLGRRILRAAWEDIGLADPRAAKIALNALNTYERLGSPEGELALAQALIYLSVTAKSNKGYVAYNQAKIFAEKNSSHPVPLHLRNAPTQLMKKLGYGKNYRYAHDEPHAYVANEQYFPEGMMSQDWYQPSTHGLEAKIMKKMQFLKTLDQVARSKK